MTRSTYPPKMRRLRAAGESHMGGRALNEDVVLLRPDLALFVVADGAGGLQLILSGDPSPETHEVNARVVRSQRRDPATSALWPHSIAVTFDRTLAHIEGRVKEIADGQR